MTMRNNLLVIVVVCTLALVMVAVIGTMLIGLFNPLVDNDKIFEILGPAFQMIVGAFVGVVGAYVGAKSTETKEIL